MNPEELLTYWRVIKKRLWLIGLLAVVTLGAITVIAYLSPPLYRASGRFQVTAPLPADVPLVSEFRLDTNRDELGYTRNNFIGVIQSNYVAGQVVESLGLEMDPDDLLERVIIELDVNSDLVMLTATASDAQLAAAIANELVNTAAHQFAELSAASFTASLSSIQRQLADRKAELETAQAALIKFQVENKIGSPDGPLRSQEELITAAKARRDEALAEGNSSVAANYDRIVAARERELQQWIMLNAEYDTLRGTVKRLQETYATLLDKETEADLKESEILSAKFIRVIPARAPSRPLPRLEPQVLLLGAFVSLALGIMLAFVLEYANHARLAAGSPRRASLAEPVLSHGQEERGEALARVR